MRKISIRLISLALILALALLALTGCTFFSDLSDAILGTYDNPDEPEAPEFKLEELINEITTSTICAEVTINVEYRSILSRPLGAVQGSGTVIMRTASTTLYVLTNAHCVTTPEDISATKYNKTFYMTDYRGNVYSNGRVYAESISEKYDLALIAFDCDNWDVQPITLADKNPQINDTVISLGTPHSQMNSITVGKVTTYYKSKLIEVDALYHTAPVGPGGSGGALLNTELELCGVNFAADETEEDFGNGSSVPIEAVREYLAAFEIFNLILN